MDKLTYTPPEFAAVFGKERTWAYRQLYKGKVQAITELGRTLIPKSEVERLLKEAGRYLGARAKVAKGQSEVEKKSKVSVGGTSWAATLAQRKKPVQELAGSGRGINGGTRSAAQSSKPAASNGARQSAYRRLTRSKA